MFIDSPAKVNYGSSGAECCYGRDTSRSAGARREGGAVGYKHLVPLGPSNVQATHYYPTTLIHKKYNMDGSCLGCFMPFVAP